MNMNYKNNKKNRITDLKVFNSLFFTGKRKVRIETNRSYPFQFPPLDIHQMGLNLLGLVHAVSVSPFV